MALSGSILGFVLSFAVVTVATYVSTSVLTSGSSIGYSAFAAGLTSLVWFGVTYLVSGAVGVSGYWVALGPLLAVIAYFLTVDLLYEGSIVRAVGISAGTWSVTFVILFAAAYMGYSSFQALGVPPGIVAG
ncbi:hypothetical protein KTS45_04785 [Halomicroarcula limicola]|uniref:Uncharacterized protein n=1 Tax=Haloarcula limicola TaxID=1429915 RepID=A0A8J7Y933_9EURY|nr:hypothetical protein [Halomicroarcula limicola]MBV0923509.1 hypothetical protein [Halomicroarcula limicola]